MKRSQILQCEGYNKVFGNQLCVCDVGKDLLAIVEEGSEATRVEVGQNGDEEGFIELEGQRELPQDLPRAVDELKEDRGALVIREVLAAVPTTLRELMPEATPLYTRTHTHAHRGQRCWDGGEVVQSPFSMRMAKPFIERKCGSIIS